MLLEICVDSLSSARAAIAGGADRLELCSALPIGGLTPYAALLEQIREESTIPVRCLMRPRAGDFLYSSDELRQMTRQIRQLRQLGADGFVLGCLSVDGKLDTEALCPLLDAAEGTGLTLHRCIDVSRDPEETYLAAGMLGFDTVLTSGAAESCTAGADMIGRLLALRDSQGGPEVLVGAGVSAAVIEHFRCRFPAARAFHMSGKEQVESRMQFRRDGISMGIPGFDEWHIPQTGIAAVKAARLALDK